MGRTYPTKVRIAGTLSSTEAVYELVKSITRERMIANGVALTTAMATAKAIQQATANGKFLELRSDGAKSGWHEHVEGACRAYDLSYEVFAYGEDSAIARHVAYVGHVGFLAEKKEWADKIGSLQILSFPRTSLSDMATRGLDPD